MTDQTPPREVKRLPYGTWISPLSANALSRSSSQPQALALDSEDRLWWSETRPNEAGRVALIRRDKDGNVDKPLADTFSICSRVHEYGGAAMWTGPAGIFFSNDTDQRLYLLDPSGQTKPLTAANRAWRFADGSAHGDWVICVREDHEVINSGASEPENHLVAIRLGAEGSEPADPVVIQEGSDFVSSPRFSRDGAWLCWVQWNHPNMPWQGTELRVAPVVISASGLGLGPATVIASGLTDNAKGPSGESLHGPNWTSQDKLIFSSDRNGFWNLYCWDPKHPDQTPTALTNLQSAEIGSPPWSLGTQDWVELRTGQLAACMVENAEDSLLLIEPDGSYSKLMTPELTQFDVIMAAAESAKVVVIGSGPTETTNVIEIDMTTAHRQPGYMPKSVSIEDGWISRAQPIEFLAENASHKAKAFFYPPTAPGIEGLIDELPPLVVMGHGGPTGHNSSALNLKVQYWTSRGFAVVDVNYRGSSGFGRNYRDLLNGYWGEADVDDCIAAARYLADVGLVDADRMVIRGSSASGLTVMLALIKSDIFAAGTSLYGVTDLAEFASHTHKFESRYLDKLVGLYPEDKHLYQQRSPLDHAAKISAPMLIMHGNEDKVVPLQQSQDMVEALRSNGLAHVFAVFDQEQHGFRRAESIERSLDLELWFYCQIFGLDAPYDIEPPTECFGLSELKR